MFVATAISHLLRGNYAYAEVLHQDHRSVEAALAIGLPLMGVIQLLTITALAGGVLALVHLMMRLLPYPKLAPAGSSLVRRVYAIER